MQGKQKRPESARKRIVRMLERGTELYELERCLNDSRKSLIAAGAKADNLPKGLSQQAGFVESLSVKAEDLVCSWFKKNADFATCGDAAAAAERLFVEPDCTDSAVWRSVLKAFILRERPPAVALWLSGAEASASLVAPSATALVGAVADIADADLLLSIAEGKVPADIQGAIPMLLAGAIEAAKGNTKVAKSWISKLASHSDPLGHTLADTVAALLRHSSPAARSIQAPLLIAQMAAEVDHLPFIGIVKKILPTGQLFVSLVALKVDGVFHEVSPVLARQIFPETGDATVFPSVVHKQFMEGEVGLWTAVRRGPEHATRCVVEKCLSRPFLPVRVPVPSTDPDAVRTWMLQSYTPSPLHQPLFLLSDGLALRLPSGHYDPNRVDFDIPLDGYRDVNWIELVGAEISFVADLPANVEKIDCAPPATLVKRLFRKLKEGEGAPSLTKAEVQALSDLASANQSALGFQLHRALAGLQAAADAQALLQGAEAELLAIPAVQEIIEAEKRRVAAAQTAQVQQAQESLSYVAKRKLALEGELEQLRNAIRQEMDERKKAGKQQEADLVRRLRTAFEKASQEGAETLAQAAVVKALLQPGSTNQPAGQSEEAAGCDSTSVLSADPFLNTGKMVESVRALRRTVEAYAGFAGLSELLLVYALAAARSSPVIALTGGGTSTVVRALAGVMAGGLHYRASVSQDMFNTGDLMRSPAVAQQADRTWAVTVGDGLASAAAAGLPAVIELRGANRAPLEALLPELLDCGPGATGVSWLDAAGALRHAGIGHPVIWILTFADGNTVFPISEGLAMSTPLLSTDGWSAELGQLVEPFVATAISSKCWKELGSAEGSTLPGTRGPVNLLAAAAQVLGVDSGPATALGRMALSVGRHVHVQAVSEGKEQGGAVAEYAKALEGRAIALQKLFGIEGA